MKQKFAILNDIVAGLKESPAYLLIFGLDIVMFWFGGVTINSDEPLKIIVGAILIIVGFISAIVAIYFVQNSKGVRQNKVRRQLSEFTELEKTKSFIREVIFTDVVRARGLQIGYKKKDPVESIPMIHKVVGFNETTFKLVSGFSYYISQFEKLQGLTFDKIVFPKSGNSIFTLQVAHQLNKPVIGFRGEDFPIAKEDNLNFLDNYFDGVLKEEDKVIIVDDITFRGDTICKTVEFLIKGNIKPVACFLLLTREIYIKSLRQRLSDLGIELHYIEKL